VSVAGTAVGVVGMAASAGSSIMGSIAASNAANAQVAAAQDANALQWKMYQQSRTDQAPWRTAGGTAVGQMASSLTPGGKSAYTQTPGYLFQVAQGTQAANQAAASQGMLLSGQQQKGLMQYGQGAAATDYQSYLNNLATVAGMGTSAATATGNAGMNAANQMGANTLYAGQARASGYMMQNAAMQQGIGNAFNVANSGGIASIFNGSSGGSYAPQGISSASYTGSIDPSALPQASDMLGSY